MRNALFTERVKTREGQTGRQLRRDFQADGALVRRHGSARSGLVTVNAQLLHGLFSFGKIFFLLDALSPVSATLLTVAERGKKFEKRESSEGDMPVNLGVGRLGCLRTLLDLSASRLAAARRAIEREGKNISGEADLLPVTAPRSDRLALRSLAENLDPNPPSFRFSPELVLELLIELLACPSRDEEREDDEEDSVKSMLAVERERG